MFLNVTSKYVCGIDLHARKMSICVMDKQGKLLFRKTLDCDFSTFLECITPYVKSVTVGVESTYNWYWLIDKLKENRINCALGHALYIKRMKSGKHKNDPVDARDIADLLRTNRFPLAYAYPQEMRNVRDLLRRRHHFVRKRAGTFTHFQNTFTQNGILDPLYAAVQKKLTRRDLLDKTSNIDIKRIVETDLDFIDSMDTIVRELEKTITARAKHHNRKHFELLHTIPGCGDITALTILYETHTIDRFETPQRYSSYCRVISSDNESSGKYLGRTTSDKIGNPYLKWALSEIVVHMLRESPLVKEWYATVSVMHGTSGAKARLRHKVALAVYHMLKKDKGFDEYKFLNIDKDRIENPSHNWTETSGKKSEPTGLIGNSSGLSSLETKKKKVIKRVVVKKSVRKILGRSSLRTTGKAKS
jgi:transposase